MLSPQFETMSPQRNYGQRNVRVYVFLKRREAGKILEAVVWQLRTTLRPARLKRRYH